MSVAHKIKEARIAARDATVEVVQAIERIRRAFVRANEVDDLGLQAALRDCDLSLRAALAAAGRTLSAAENYEATVRRHVGQVGEATLVAAQESTRRARFVFDDLAAGVLRDWHPKRKEPS